MNQQEPRPDSKLHCKYHPDVELVEDYHAGDILCPECGLVVADRCIDFSPEWRTFCNDDNHGDDPSRVGAPENPLLSGNSLSTVIMRPKRIASFSDNQFPRYTNYSPMDSSDRVLLTAQRTVSEMAGRLHLPKLIVDRALSIFKQVQETKKLDHYSNMAKASVCLYIGCRQEGTPRTFKEICSVSGVAKRQIGRCFKLVLKALETNLSVINSADFMSRFCRNLDLPIPLRSVAVHIARKGVELDYVPGRSPVSIAAASIYLTCLASNVNMTPKTIGKALAVGDNTIYQSYRLLRPHADKLFPEDFKFIIPISELPE